MRKLSLHLLSLFAAVSMFTMTSCTGDEETVDPAPTATIASTTPATAKAGDEITLSAAVVAQSKIKSIVTRLDNADLDTKTSGFTNSTSDNYSFKYAVPSTAGGKELKFTIVVTDNKDRVVNTNHTVKVDAIAGEINTYSARLFGGQANNSAGSFFRSSDGTVLKTADADKAPATIDLIYLYSDINKAVFTAPNDATVAQAHASVATWSTKNATKISGKASITKEQFAAITDDSAIVAAAANANATRVNDLQVDNVFAFVTAAGKKGLVLVEKIEGIDATNRSITVSVKIQKSTAQ
jgi:hypothetical protein